MMKNLVLVFALFVCFAGLSQEPPKMPKYNAKNAAGIFYYNVVDASKKIKLKKKDVKAKFNKAISNYNYKIKELSFLNTPKLNGVDLTVNSIGEQAFRNSDLADKVRKAISENVTPVRDSVIKFEKELNTTLETVLNKKQFKKWIKYQKAEKRKLLPEGPKQNNNNMNNSMMNRNRNRMRGMGGLGGRRF